MTVFEQEGGADEVILIGSENLRRLVTCQSQSSHALKPAKVYHLFDSEWDHNLQNENHPVLKKT